MTLATRRLWLYGFLLLLPALAVGGVALGLLAREHARLLERERVAVDARRAALDSRARLISENIVLLASDVQDALMATLREAPAEEPRAFLAAWQQGNPLVREIFCVTSDGRLVWGPSSDAVRAWLAAGSPRDNIVSPAAVETAPAAAAFAPTMDAIEPRNRLGEASVGYSQILSNVNQYQSARQSLQQVAKLGSNSGNSANGVNMTLDAASAQVPALDARSQVRSGIAAGLTVPAAPGASLSVMDGYVETRGTDVDLAVAGREGWSTWRGADGLHVFAWRELPDGTLVGFELALSMIKLRLREVLPLPEPGEAYALRDEMGVQFHSTQLSGVDYLPPIEVPLGGFLTDWRVLARLEAGALSSGDTRGVLVPAAVLVALLVAAILFAGALLVRQARRSEEEAAAKTSFVANVSHELKTPLTTIRLYAELLAQGRVRDEGRRGEYLATIGRETERLGRLVGNVLDFSRLEQGQKKFARTPLDVAVELRRLIEVHAPRLAEAGLSVRLDAPNELALETDADALGQIVLNLIDNACKYASGSGELFFALTALSVGGAELRVADRGPGVPADQRERIFEKFHRVDERLTAEQGGAGLGLSIARRLARGLGGDLHCRARAGGGAEFVLTLPVSRS